MKAGWLPLEAPPIKMQFQRSVYDTMTRYETQIFRRHSCAHRPNDNQLTLLRTWVNSTSPFRACVVARSRLCLQAANASWTEGSSCTR